MIAAISLLLIVIGWVMINVLGAPYLPYSMFHQPMNKWDVAGVAMALSGLVGAVASLFIVLWRYAP